MKHRALLLEGIHASAVEVFESAGFSVRSARQAMSESELISELEGVEVLGIRSKTRVTPAVFAARPELLTVGCFCIGVNQVELAAAKQSGTPVFNAPFSNTRSVAEMVVAEVICLARQIADRSREVHEGRWQKVATHCYEVRGKTLGIVGYGHIGRQVGVLAESLGMQVVFYDIASRLPMGNNRPVSSLDDLLSRSDFVTLHVPETAQTRHMIREPQLTKMRAGSYLLNLSRGQVVDVDALASALKSKHLAGAAVDVFPEEPEGNGPGFSSPLCGLPNVILTPHVGGSTLEAQEAIGREVSEKLVEYVRVGTTTSSVNFPEVALPKPLHPSTTQRVLNVHHNVPGVLRDIHTIVSATSANIEGQVLATDTNIGYLLMDLGKEVSADVQRGIAALSTSIRTRIVG